MTEPALLWHTRPTDDSATFADELAPLGIKSIIGPVLHIVQNPIAAIVADAPDALLITSRHATHALAALPTPWRSLPTYCVGNATAQAASSQGHTRIITGISDVKALLPRLAADLPKGSRVHYFAGDETRMDVKKLLAARGIEVTMQVVYHALAEASLTSGVHAALSVGHITGVALFSPRSARIASDLMEQAGLATSARDITAYCFSLNVAKEAARLPWAALHSCALPTRKAMRELIVSHHAKT